MQSQIFVAMNTPSLPTHIKATELAKVLNISTDTLKKWCDNGKFLGLCLEKTFIIDLDSFKKFYDKHSNKHTYLENCRSEILPRK